MCTLINLLGDLKPVEEGAKALKKNLTISPQCAGRSIYPCKHSSSYSELADWRQGPRLCVSLWWLACLADSRLSSLTHLKPNYTVRSVLLIGLLECRRWGEYSNQQQPSDFFRGGGDGGSTTALQWPPCDLFHNWVFWELVRDGSCKLSLQLCRVPHQVPTLLSGGAHARPQPKTCHS